MTSSKKIPFLFKSINATEYLALAKFVFQCRRSPARLLFSRGCHEAECESKYVWPTLSSILSLYPWDLAKEAPS